jgi:hypothetical protein
MTEPLPAPDEALLQALISELTDQGRALLEQGQGLTAVQAVVGDLATTVSKLAAAKLAAPAVVCWVDLDQQAADAAWPPLRSWVDQVLTVRYPHVSYTKAGSRLVAPCWYRHPFAVEEISALYHSWCRAFRDPSAPVTDANDWHKRLAEACQRVGQQVKCPPTGHNEDPAGAGTDDDFDAFAAADIISRSVKPPDQD